MEAQDNPNQILDLAPDQIVPKTYGEEVALGSNFQDIGGNTILRNGSFQSSDGSWSLDSNGNVTLPTANAYHQVAFTQVLTNSKSGSYTDLDLSSIVGAKSALVFLQVMTDNNGGASLLSVRRNGDTTDYYTGAVASANNFKNASANTPYGILVIDTDSSGIIEWRNGNALNEISSIWVMGYIT